MKASSARSATTRAPAAAGAVSALKPSAAVHTSSSPRSATTTQPARALFSTRTPGRALTVISGSVRGLDTHLRILAPVRKPTPGSPRRHPRQRRNIRHGRRLRSPCAPARGTHVKDSARLATSAATALQAEPAAAADDPLDGRRKPAVAKPGEIPARTDAGPDVRPPPRSAFPARYGSGCVSKHDHGHMLSRNAAKLQIGDRDREPAHSPDLARFGHPRWRRGRRPGGYFLGFAAAGPRSVRARLFAALCGVCQETR